MIQQAFCSRQESAQLEYKVFFLSHKKSGTGSFNTG